MKKIISILLIFAFMNIVVLPTHAVVVKAGRIIPIQYSGEPVNSKNLTPGSIVYGKVSNNIIVDGVKIFEAGALVTMNVIEVKKSRCAGVPGYILLINGTAQDVKGEDRDIEFDYDVKGIERSWPKAMMGLGIILFPLLLFGFVHGGEAQLNSTQIINSKLINDFKI